mmetsp:Transcript_102966/g.297732  ORF Transcript_102966/g.297732 Transcript_102966/m.297732 type:complete len:590 (-) Transcript_102966:263-2032(-)
MVQCSSGLRAGALLLLWFAQKYNYNAASVAELAQDVMKLKFWTSGQLRHYRAWVLEKVSGTGGAVPAALHTGGDAASPHELLAAHLGEIPDMAAARGSPSCLALSPSQLGVKVPVMPGDVGLCGDLSKAAVAQVAGQYASWVYLNAPSNPAFCAEDLRQAGVQHVEVCPLPSTFLPSDAQTAAALDAMGRLPRPVMVQCSSGDRAAALLLLWFAKTYGYDAESVHELAKGIMGLEFWEADEFSHYRAWVLAKLPTAGSAPNLPPSHGPTSQFAASSMPSEGAEASDFGACAALASLQVGEPPKELVRGVNAGCEVGAHQQGGSSSSAASPAPLSRPRSASAIHCMNELVSTLPFLARREPRAPGSSACRRTRVPSRRGAPAHETSFEALGIIVPYLPGDIAICGDLSAESLAKVTGHYNSWLYLQTPDDSSLVPDELMRAGALQVEVVHGDACGLNDAVLEALDRLPRPVMMQCASANRAGALLLSWLSIRGNYGVATLQELARDTNLRIWAHLEPCWDAFACTRTMVSKGEGSSTGGSDLSDSGSLSSEFSPGGADLPSSTEERCGESWPPRVDLGVGFTGLAALRGL